MNIEAHTRGDQFTGKVIVCEDSVKLWLRQITFDTIEQLIQCIPKPYILCGLL